MSDGQGEVLREIESATWRHNPALVPHDKAGVALMARRVASDMQALANAMAAVGMGRGVWPEHSAELLGASEVVKEWAGKMDKEASEGAERNE